MKMKSGLICMAGVTLLQPEAGSYSASQVCKTESHWQQRCLAREAWHLPLSACPPHVWGKVTNLFIFPGAPVLVLSGNSIHQTIRVVKELGGGRPTRPPAKGSPNNFQPWQTLLDSNLQVTSKEHYSTIELISVIHKKCLTRDIQEYFYESCVERTWFFWVKHSKDLKGQSRAPSVSTSPSHLTKMTRMQSAHFH